MIMQIFSSRLCQGKTEYRCCNAKSYAAMVQLDLGGLQTLAPGEGEIIVSVSSVGLSDSVTNGSVKPEISAPFELNTSVPITLTKGVVGTQLRSAL